jgi:mannose-6-phosphate isomerase-like protein (cupin superfamily)
MGKGCVAKVGNPPGCFLAGVWRRCSSVRELCGYLPSSRLARRPPENSAPVSHFDMDSKGYFLITPDDLHWRPSNLMKIPNADYLERTGSENLGARLWRLPPKSANTLHKHVRAEEFYLVLEGTGRMRVGEETLTVPKYGGVLVGPDQMRQVFNDTDAEVLWLIIGGPEELEFLQGSKSKMDLSLIYPTDPTQLPKELAGVQWPPTGSARSQ